MGEILFRGKLADQDTWVEGSLIVCGEEVRMFADSASAGTGIFSVDPATVGQYTGLTANGKKIFKGDIADLECDPGLNELWVFDYGNCGGVQNVAHDVGYMGFYLRPLSDNAIKARDYGQRDDPIYYLNALRLRIVGNIHDNPELLKGEDLRT